MNIYSSTTWSGGIYIPQYVVLVETAGILPLYYWLLCSMVEALELMETVLVWITTLKLFTVIWKKKKKLEQNADSHLHEDVCIICSDTTSLYDTIMILCNPVMKLYCLHDTVLYVKSKNRTKPLFSVHSKNTCKWDILWYFSLYNITSVKDWAYVNWE